MATRKPRKRLPGKRTVKKKKPAKVAKKPKAVKKSAGNKPAKRVKPAKKRAVRATRKRSSPKVLPKTKSLRRSSKRKPAGNGKPSAEAIALAREIKQTDRDLEEVKTLHPLVLSQRPQPIELPDREVMISIINLIRQGAPPQVACGYCGITVATLQRWWQVAAKHEDSRIAQFLRACYIAQCQDEITDIQLISLGVKHARDLEWKRERRTPERWGPKQIGIKFDVAAIFSAGTQSGEEETLEGTALLLAMLEKHGAIPEVSEKNLEAIGEVLEGDPVEERKESEK